MYDNGRGCIVQGYNAQLAVDAEAQVIVAAEVTKEVLDRGELLAMMESTAQNAGQTPGVVTADAGYWDTDIVQQALHTTAQVLVSPDGAAACHAGRPRQMATIRWRRACARNWPSDTGRALYRMRQAIVEPVIGYIKDVRGFRRFTLRRLGRVRAEWRIICMTHNLLKLFRHCRRPATG